MVDIRMYSLSLIDENRNNYFCYVTWIKQVPKYTNEVIKSTFEYYLNKHKIIINYWFQN